jgi:hypothetical protein
MKRLPVRIVWLVFETTPCGGQTEDGFALAERGFRTGFTLGRLEIVGVMIVRVLVFLVSLGLRANGRIVGWFHGRNLV